MLISRSIKRKKTCTSFALILLILALSYGTFGGCGTEFDSPSTTQTPTALISTATLKAWIDSGKVNGTGYDRVVILDVNSASAYATGHVPGAYFLDSGTKSEDRNDGVFTAISMVLDGASMDALVQKYGIDEQTTIVFAGGSWASVPRVYWMFRYWGFPKNRLKMLDGRNAQWDTDYGLTTALPPPATPSTFSVRDNPSFRGDLRVSFGEMINAVDGSVPNVVILDAQYSISTKTPFGERMKGAVVFDGTDRALLGTTVFNPTDQIVAAFTAKGLDSTKTAYVYCTQGNVASFVFFALDGILGWPVALYDGSWVEWGLAADSTLTDTGFGGLDTTSPWRTDTAARSEPITYNTYDIINNPSDSITATDYDSFAPGANRIETEDAEYMNSGGTGGSSGGGGGITPGC